MTRLAIIVALLAFVSSASANERPAPRQIVLWRAVPHVSTWLQIGMCEQPKRGISWHDTTNDTQRYRSIDWHGGLPNYPGGLGFLKSNWTNFRPFSARHITLMSDATPVQQLQAAERIYQHFAAIGGSGYGATVWVCHQVIGWYGFNADGSWR